MGKRRTADQIQRLLREADRDLAKGLTVGDPGTPGPNARRQRQHLLPLAATSRSGGTEKGDASQ
jgi:hypothetical protein